MVQKLEELRESGTAPYSDTYCAMVSLTSTSLMWSDRTAPRLRPLQLLAHTYMYATDHHYACCYITSECKSLWGEPERVHRMSVVNIEDECTV